MILLINVLYVGESAIAEVTYSAVFLALCEGILESFHVCGWVDINLNRQLGKEK